MDKTVFIVDDDPSVRDSLSLLLGLHGYRTAIFASGESFLASRRDDWYGCLIVDLRMDEMDGLTLQQKLREMGSTLPVIIITGHGDVTSACAAFRSEAVDFIEKPLDENHLLAAIEEALSRQEERKNAYRREAQLVERLAQLTQREQEVMQAVVSGKHNRDIAAELGISVRTVEVHKARMMSKLGVHGIPQLVRISLGLSAKPEITPL
ncbi:MAG: response regulator [Gallionella sp.]|nr:response regulator [Gallionella sp.]